MPKMKTHKAAAKRVKRTGSGSFRHFHAYGSHILTKKSSRRKRGYRQATLAHESNENVLRVMLPYSRRPRMATCPVVARIAKVFWT